MAPHQPFPIADVDTGMYQAKEPWLSPNNAFVEVNDAYVFRSRIHRRKGYDRFSSCGVASASGYTKGVIGPAAEGTRVYELTTLTTRVVPESIDLTWNDPVNGNIFALVEKDSFKYQAFGGVDGYGWSVVDSVTGTQIGTCTQPYTTTVPTSHPAQILVRWADHSLYTGIDVATPNGSMVWKEDPELPIVGLSSYKSTDSTEFLIAINTTRLFVYNVTRGYFDDLVAANTFTGTSSDLFWTWPLEDDLLITNGVDRVKRYDGPAGTLTNMGTTIGAGPNVVDLANLVIFYRNRVIYLNVQEGGTAYPRRARWSRAGAYQTLDVEDFADAPTEMGAAITVEFIGDRIMVGFQKGWMELVYTADPQSLFEWEKTTSIYGSTARNGAIADGERILARTDNGIEALDPNQQYSADIDIPDFVVDRLDSASAGLTYGVRNIPLRQFWWSAVTPMSTTGSADEILVAQYGEDDRLGWSRYKVPFNCFTEFRSESGANWDDIDTNWDDYEGAWDSAANLSGFPFVLAGHRNGLIYKSDNTLDHFDDRPYNDPLVVDYLDIGPQGVPFEIRSERLSPFPGQNSHLGWVDFYMEAATGVTITVEFRGNSRLAAYKTASFDLTPSGANEKIYRRLRVNKTALFHTMTIKANGGGAFAIDAIIPWFRAAGRMREFG